MNIHPENQSHLQGQGVHELSVGEVGSDSPGTAPKNDLLSGQSGSGTPRKMAGPGAQAGVGLGWPAFAGSSR